MLERLVIVQGVPAALVAHVVFKGLEELDAGTVDAESADEPLVLSGAGTKGGCPAYQEAGDS